MGFLEILGGIVVFIIILGVIIAVHEGGHFFFARRAKVLAREFAFGMGPTLWKKKKGETVYSIRAFPIGGFCAIAGEELEDNPFKTNPRVKLDIQDGVIHNFYLDVENENINYPIYDIMEYDIFDEANTGNLYMEVISEGNRYHFKVKPDAIIHLKKQEYQIAPYNRTIGSKSKRARAMVMFGGPLMNFLLSIVTLFIVGLLVGFADPGNTSVNVLKDNDSYNAALLAGLENDDKITKLETKDGEISKQINKWQDISDFMVEYKSKANTTKIVVTFNRNNEAITKEVLPAIAFNNLAISVINHEQGLEVVNYIASEDDLLNNKSLEKYYIDDSGNKKTLIITSFEHNGSTILASNLRGVYELLDNYEGKNKEKIKINLLSDNSSASVEVLPYNKALMEYLKKQNQVDSIKVFISITPIPKFNLLKSFSFAFTQTAQYGTEVFSTLKMLFKGDIGLKSLRSFVGIADVAVKVSSKGLVPILSLAALLSVNVGLLNLLPIPALDGGRLVFLGYEAITKKKPNQKVETWLITITMLLLFALMIYATINDILRI